MHDRMTVAFEIRWPFGGWRDNGGHVYRPPFITIWHVDPEKDGSDDSCDWFNHGKAEDRQDPKRQAVHEAIWDMETILDNRPHYPDSPAHRAFQPLKKAIWELMAPPPRRWWRHPRWHVWHWRVQIHPLQKLRRWLLSRCCHCGKRFKWNESVVGLHWNEPPRRWFESFRSERDIAHHDCAAAEYARTRRDAV